MDYNSIDFQSDQILTALSSEEIAHVKSKMQLLYFKKKQLLFYEDGVPTGAFLIQKGKAKIFKVGVEGKEQIFYIYKEGDLLGYHALLGDEPYEDACEVLEDSEILFISKEAFDELMEEIPKLKRLLIKNMSHEFGVLVNIITVLAQMSLRERLAFYLLILKNRYQNQENPNGLISLSRNDLANLLGATRESLGRELKNFRDDGYIEIIKKTIWVKQIDTLNQIANLYLR